jgi:hypothetical protein
MTFNTGNPVGSTDARDLYDNAQNLDKFSLGQELEYPDRLGVPRKSLAGIRAEVTEALSRLGYQVIGDYAAGLVVQNFGQVFRKDGEFYRAKAALALPYPLNGNWAVDAPNFVSVGDAVLRQELAGDNGAGHVSFKQPLAAALRRALDLKLLEHVSVRDFGAVGDGVTDDTAAIQAAFDSLAGAFNGWVRNPGSSYFDSSTLDGPTARVHFPRGLYKITEELRVPRGLLITGENARNHGGSRIKQFGGGGKYCFNLYGYETPNGQYIADQQINGIFFSSVSGGGIRAVKPAASSAFHSSGSLSISNCFFLDIASPAGVAYAAVDCDYIERIENCTFDAIEAAGIRAAHISCCTGNTFFFNGRSGIVLDLRNYRDEEFPTTIIGNTFVSCGSAVEAPVYCASIGILGTSPSQDLRGLLVVGNTFGGVSGAGVHGIVSESVRLDGAVISGNMFLSLKGDPIKLSHALDCNISNNHFKACANSSLGAYVLGVEKAELCRFTGNTFYGNYGLKNIRLSTGSYGNVFDGNYQDSDRFEATAQYGRRINEITAGVNNVITTGPATGWISAPLAGTWVSVVGNEVQYRRDELGRVVIRGAAQGGSGLVFNLPAGFRPEASRFYTFMCKSGGVGGYSVLQVDDIGNVSVTELQGGSSANTDLGTISFYAEG